MDVTSLYTCIPHSDGLQYFLNKRTTMYPPIDTLIRLAELVLNKNTFSFKCEVVSQMSGVAMGTKRAPATHVSLWDTLNKNCSKTTANQCPRHKRYIGDGIGATSMSHSQLLDFIEFV